ncbi:hypothetical protein ACFRFH_03300 [Leifsonia sp. NPDC056824]
MEDEAVEDEPARTPALRYDRPMRTHPQPGTASLPSPATAA